MKAKKWRNKNLWIALLHSLEGIKGAFQTEINLKIHLVCAVIAIMAGVFFTLTTVEWLILYLTIGIVLVTEMVNTAIEIVLDLYSEKYNEKIKVAKDISSGAVLMAAMVSIIVGCILFLPKIIK